MHRPLAQRRKVARELFAQSAEYSNRSGLAFARGDKKLAERRA